MRWMLEPFRAPRFTVVGRALVPFLARIALARLNRGAAAAGRLADLHPPS